MNWLKKLFQRNPVAKPWTPLSPLPSASTPMPARRSTPRAASRVPTMSRPALRPSYPPSARVAASPAPAPDDGLSTLMLVGALSMHASDAPVSAPCAAPSFSSGGGGDFGGGGASSSWDSGSSSSDSGSSSSDSSSSSGSSD